MVVLLLGPSVLPTSAQDASGPAPEEDFPGGRLVAAAHPGRLDALVARMEARGAEILHRSDAIGAVTVKSSDAPGLAAAARGWAEAAHVHPDALVAPSFRYPANDPELSEQWALPVTALPTAWATTRGTSNTVIAVLDSGAQLDHPDLAGAWWTDPNNGGMIGRDWVDPSLPPHDNIGQCGGHGTHVAGTAAARIGNGVGIAGASNAKIMPIKVFQIINGQCLTWMSDVYNAAEWAVNNGAHIVSLSLGYVGTAPNPTEEAMYDHIVNDLGAVVVAAAGNDACSGCLHYPAAYDAVIAVANLASHDTRSSSSNQASWVDVAAPGTSILSTCVGSTYCLKSGTSMATPLVAGVLALKKSLDPSWSASSLRHYLQVTSVDIGSPGFDNAFGHGRIDAASFLAMETGMSPAFWYFDTTGSMSLADPCCVYQKWTRTGAWTVSEPYTKMMFELTWSDPAAEGTEQMEFRIVRHEDGKEEEVAAWLMSDGFFKEVFHLPPGSYSYYVYGRHVVDEDHRFLFRRLPQDDTPLVTLPHARMLAGTVATGATPVPWVRLVEETYDPLLNGGLNAYWDGVDLVPDDPDLSFHRLEFAVPSGSTTAQLKFQARPVPGTEGVVFVDEYDITVRDAADVVVASWSTFGDHVHDFPLTGLTGGATYSVGIVYRYGEASDIEVEVTA